jgi:hypothetical protein
MTTASSATKDCKETVTAQGGWLHRFWVVVPLDQKSYSGDQRKPYYWHSIRFGLGTGFAGPEFGETGPCNQLFLY